MTQTNISSFPFPLLLFSFYLYALFSRLLFIVLSRLAVLFSSFSFSHFYSNLLYLLLFFSSLLCTYPIILSIQSSNIRISFLFCRSCSAFSSHKFLHLVIFFRALVAVLENYQQPDGSVLIPKKLQPYMNNTEVLTVPKGKNTSTPTPSSPPI